MNKNNIKILFLLLLLGMGSCNLTGNHYHAPVTAIDGSPLTSDSIGVQLQYDDKNEFVSYVADLQKQTLKLYWKGEDGVLFSSLGNLRKALLAKGKTLLFAMNGGMYKPDYSPQGLYIQEGKIMQVLDTLEGEGNFYKKPNGVFYTTTEGKGFVCKTEDFKSIALVNYATQSGPMLLTEGKMHPDFRVGSRNLNIRNGVGVLPNGTLLFAQSTVPVNFYDFARYFQKQGCANALYLDGLVSRTYLPAANWEQLDGDFGVLIGVTNRAEELSESKK